MFEKIIPQYILVGMGNPLLDLMISVDKNFLEKYNLKENNAILAEKKHLPLFDEILKQNDVTFVPGGATQNTLKTFQWIVNKPHCATFFGAVGVDKFSEILNECVKLSGLNVQYQYKPNEKTGTCAGLVFEHNRSLCADLGAANTFTIDHLEKNENMYYINKAQFFYISGFFVTVCLPAILLVAEHAVLENKCFCFNLAASFICTLYSEQITKILPYVDILFLNDEEAIAFAENQKFETKNLKEIALKLSNYKKINKKKERTVIITQGPNEIVVAINGQTVQFFNPPKIENIVDTNGAGDAFCGGFLAELVKGSELAKCIECACFAASVVIQNHGCTFPSKCDYKI